MIISFNASTAESLPKTPAGYSRLTKVSFRTCPGSDLSIVLVKDGGSERNAPVDAHGMLEDSWWCVRCKDLPDRETRLTRGSYSLRELLRRYGFQDSTGCVNHREAEAHYAKEGAFRPSSLSCVPPHLLDATGVPQFYRDSGVCWYAALCWSTFANPTLGNKVISYLDEDLRESAGKCLRSRKAAEHLRKQLWYRYAVGDNVEDPPYMDGRNGFSELCTLFAKLQIPMLRFREDGGKMYQLEESCTDRHGKRIKLPKVKNLDAFHVLAMRFQDGDHQNKFPVLRRVCFKGRRYRLVGVFAGQRKCGHQIGFCSPTGHWRDWSIADADLHKDGIGPLFVRFEGERWKRDWWQAWRQLVHMTKFGPGNSNFCSLSPWNEADDAYDQYRSSSSGRRRTKVGSNSLDLMYIRDLSSMTSQGKPSP